MTKYLRIIVLMGLCLSQDEEFIYSTLIDTTLEIIIIYGRNVYKSMSKV